MSNFLPYFLWLPLAGFLASIFIHRKKEKVLSGLAILVSGLQLLLLISFSAVWFAAGHPLLHVKSLVLYHSRDFEFFMDFYFDKVTMVFSLTGAFLTFVIALFSKYYMHRDEGFKRFFSKLLLFYCGYNLIVFAGNFETLFLGWELIGITSFLLIAFYRDRFLPVKNAFKVLSFYRIGDVFLILALWLSHHLWHKNITFDDLNSIASVKQQFSTHYYFSFALALLVIMAAVIKSAQFPFSTWLPRAMEGPTSSSAVFYGSLSVHTGLFLLLRTFSLWEHDIVLKSIVMAVGLLTAIVATSIAVVQSTVKTQIAYSSAAQIGLMFIEVALGWHVLALIHYTGNALLRTYQLLVSPSVLSYLIHQMPFSFRPRIYKPVNTLYGRFKNSWYLLSLKEWNLDYLLYSILWRPFKRVGKFINKMHADWSMIAYLLLVTVSLVAYYFRTYIAGHWREIVPVAMLISGLGILLSGFAGKSDARRVWILVFLSQLCMLLALVWNSPVDFQRILLYLCGTVTGAISGYWCLHKLSRKEGLMLLDRYHGHSYEYPVLALLFLISCLALIGFPLSPTFVGIDLLFLSIHTQQLFMISAVAMNFILLELSILRIFIRVFLGPHCKNYHPVAFTTS